MQQTTIYQMTIADLMGEDFDVWLKRNGDMSYKLNIDSCEETVFIDEDVHECAIESMADFCKRFLHCYERLNHE